MRRFQSARILTLLSNAFLTAAFCWTFGVAATASVAFAEDALAPSSEESGGAARPNVVLILTDDMGFSDVGCFGSEIPTPNLDALASGGIRFTQFYNTARCCPSRASLLTGLHPHQAGVGHMLDDKGPDFPGYSNGLNDRCVTIAEVLRSAGYATYAVGKWHVVNANSPNQREDWPLQRGFERYYGTIAGAADYFDPAKLYRDNNPIEINSDPEYKPENYYFTDAIADNAAAYIRQNSQNGDKPFFMYVAFTAAHWPLQAPEEEIARFRGKYDVGYRAIREARIRRLVDAGIVDSAWKPAPQIGNRNKSLDWAWETRCMEVYAAQVARMDAGVGKIVAELKAQGKFENTLILYLQDNGGCAENTGRDVIGPKIAERNAATFDPIDDSGVVGEDKNDDGADDGSAFAIRAKTWRVRTRDGRPVKIGVGTTPGAEDSFVAYGESWANVSNSPFRLYKHFLHEGGISTPLIASWPAGISRSGGELEKTPAQLPDVLATLVDVCGAEYPKKRGEIEVVPAQGVSVAPLFVDSSAKIERDGLFWEHEGNRAVRVGDWKLVAKGPGGAWELYDMKSDRTETTNLAAQNPEIVRELEAKWRAWAERVGATPWIWNPAYSTETVK